MLQDRTKLAEVIDRKLELPSVPSMALRVLEAAGDERTGLKELSRLIEADPALAAWLLRIANSAFYGCSRFISSVPQAVRLVGTSEVRNLAVAVASRKLYAKTTPVEQGLWASAVASAVASHLLARRFAPDVRENAFLAGQMHDVGRVLMYQQAPDAYAASESLAKEYGLPSAERALYGFSHTDVGGVIMMRWKLPEILETVASSHHSHLSPSGDKVKAARLNDCVIVADYLCYRAGIGAAPGAAEIDKVLDRALEDLRIDKGKLDELQEAFNAALAEARAFFS